MSCWKDAHFLAPCHTQHGRIIYSLLCPLHLPELMARKKLIIRFNLDYNVCSPDQQQQFVKHMQQLCGVLLTSCRTLLWRTGTLHTRWGKTRLTVFWRGKSLAKTTHINTTASTSVSSRGFRNSTHFYIAAFWLSESSFHYNRPG